MRSKSSILSLRRIRLFIINYTKLIITARRSTFPCNGSASRSPIYGITRNAPRGVDPDITNITQRLYWVKYIHICILLYSWLYIIICLYKYMKNLYINYTYIDKTSKRWNPYHEVRKLSKPSERWNTYYEVRKSRYHISMNILIFRDGFRWRK